MNSKIIEALLSPYNENSRFLKSFELLGEKGLASFETNSNFYCISQQPVHHFTAVELQVCLNQLLYTYFARLGLLNYDKNASLNPDFINALNANNFIIEQNTHFKKAINASQPIKGEIEITKSKKIGDSSYIECSFLFGDGCFGTVKSILKNGNI